MKFIIATQERSKVVSINVYETLVCLNTWTHKDKGHCILFVTPLPWGT